jgi:RNA polymerase-binding transcription factor DksA
MVSNLGQSSARAELEAERGRLVSELADLGAGPEGGLAYDANFADTSQVTAERGGAEALATELKDTLAEVDAALVRLEQGTYGVCESCGAEITPARLEAVPATSRCIACASVG